MMRIQISDHLPIISAMLNVEGINLRFDKVLLDTGSAGTLFPFAVLREAGIQPPPEARIREMTGIGGGLESVVEFSVDALVVGEWIRCTRWQKFFSSCVSKHQVQRTPKNGSAAHLRTA